MLDDKWQIGDGITAAVELPREKRRREYDKEDGVLAGAYDGLEDYEPCSAYFPYGKSVTTNVTCIHTYKVYADYQLQSYPPQRPWICPTCGAEGTDFVKLPEQPESYDDIKKRFGKS